MTEEQERNYRMLHLLANHFYLAQIIGMNTSATEEQHYIAVDRMMKTIQHFYANPEEAKDDIVAFGEQLGTTVNVAEIPLSELGKEAKKKEELN